MFDKLQKDWRKLLKKYNVDLSESVISMVLGAVVVVLVGFLAYNYFKTKTPAAQTQMPTDQQESQGELAVPENAVSLPTTHTVAAGESLWKVAEEYYKSGYNYVDIAAANQLRNPGELEVGQKLTIPKVEVRQPLTVAGASVPSVTTNKIEGDSYTVEKGDFLWEIAVRAYGDGYKWTEIAKANNLTNPNLIFSGNVLKLPR